MNDLDDRISRAAAAVREATESLQAPPIARVNARDRRRLAVRAFAAVAALVVAVVGGAAILRSGDAAPPAATDPTSTTTTTTATTVPEVEDWAGGRVVLSESPRVVQAPLEAAAPGLDLASESILLPIDALSARDLEIIGPYDGLEPVIAVGTNPRTGERFFVVPDGWTGTFGRTPGPCYLVGESAFCDTNPTEVLVSDVDATGYVRVVGRAPAGAAVLSVTASWAGGEGTAWQRPRGGYAMIDVPARFPATVVWEARDAGGGVLGTGRFDGIGAGLTACSGWGLPLPSAQAGLPTAVATVRRDMARAASTCDYPALASLAADGFVSSFGGTGIERLVESEFLGEPLLATLVTILEMPYAAVTDGNGSTTYVWPSAFDGTWDEVPQADKDALRPLYSDEDLAGFADFGAYIGWRVGITADGEWRFFVAGD